MVILYPSTVFIDENKSDFKEYVTAKLEGESLYFEQNRQDNIEVCYKRLPRLKTDQTSGILAVNTADNFEVMYKVIKELSLVRE